MKGNAEKVEQPHLKVPETAKLKGPIETWAESTNKRKKADTSHVVDTIHVVDKRESIANTDGNVDVAFSMSRYVILLSAPPPVLSAPQVFCNFGAVTLP